MTHPDVQALQRLGKSGKWKQNIERDFLRQTRRMFGIWLEPVAVETVKLKASTGLLEGSTAYVMYAHEVIAALAEEPQRFAAVFLPPDGSSTSRFWECVLSSVFVQQGE